MAQINIALDDHIVANLDRIADGKGLRRPDLLRAAIAELIEAHDSGRLAFQASDGPRLDASISSLVHQLREALIELDRAQAENVKQFGKLIAQSNDSEEASQRALERLTRQINDINRKSYTPFLEKLKPVHEAISSLPQAVAKELEPNLARIAAQLDANRKLAEQPRTERNLILGDDRMLSLKFLGATHGMALLFGALVVLIVTSLFQFTAVGVAGRLVTNPARMCRLVERQYGVRDCVVPKFERETGMRIIAQEDKP
jgi:hypothetical protein